MPGPLPKPAAKRRRTNTIAGATNLRAVESPSVPALPFNVCEATATWWSDIWKSEMAGEWLSSDRHGLYLLARLVDDYWTAEDAGVRAKLATEIRLQRQCFGLTPQDRRRLQWNTERADVTGARMTTRKAPVARTADPRLKEV